MNCNTRNLTTAFLASMLLPSLLLVLVERLSFFSIVAALLIPAGFYMLWINFSKKPGLMILCALPFIILNACEMVQLYLFGQGVFSGNMFTSIFTTSASEAGELLKYLLVPIAAICVVYVPVIVWAASSLRCRHMSTLEQRQKYRVVAFLVVLTGGISASLSKMDGRPQTFRHAVMPGNIIAGIVSSTREVMRAKEYPANTAHFYFDPERKKTGPGREVYVLVIGETSRAMNWAAYGYDRKTSPRLDTTRGTVVFRDVITQCNTTHRSVPMILSPRGVLSLKYIYYSKGMPALFKEAGFKSIFLSNQPPDGEMIENFASDADTVIYLERGSMDGDLADSFERMLDETPGDLFAVLHCYGSHFNYSKRYPDSCRVFVPDHANLLSQSQRDKWINAYDNTIYYTDTVLSSIIERLKREEGPSALMFCADHGEDIFDDRRKRFLHASPDVSIYQLHIPLIAWMSKQYIKRHPDRYRNASQNATACLSTRNIFHSMAGMAGIESYCVDSTLSVFSESLTEPPRYILNEQDNSATPLSMVPLTEEDYEVMRGMGMSSR